MKYQLLFIMLITSCKVLQNKQAVITDSTYHYKDTTGFYLIQRDSLNYDTVHFKNSHSQTKVKKPYKLNGNDVSMLGLIFISALLILLNIIKQ